MCFSATASFTAGAALLPAGVYCCRQALRKERRLLPLAVVPILFGIQQVAEGFVWLAVNRGDTPAATGPALVFLFFALAFWPFWPAFSANFLPLSPPRRVVAGALLAVSLFWFVFLFGQIALDPDRYLNIRVVHHSLHYGYDHLPLYDYIPQPLLRTLYFLNVAAPMLLGVGESRQLRWFGLLLVGSVVVSYLLFAYAFTSVWCFFAAVISGYLCVVFRALPEPAAAPAATPALVSTEG